MCSRLHCLCAGLRLSSERRAWLSCGLLAAVRYSVGDESDRPISDRQLLGRPHKGVDDPRHRGLKALYSAKDKAKKWLFGTVGMAVISAALAAIMMLFMKI